MSGRPAVASAVRLALAAFLAFLLSGGGRITGSDEVTMYQLAGALLHGRIDVPEGATLQGADGRFYTKNTAGQAVLALPFVAAGKGLAAVAGLRDERAELAARMVASTFNAVVTALLLAAAYLALRAFRVRPRAALATTFLLGFSTPLWVYAKSFMAEPLEALGLLLALAGAARAGADASPSAARRGGWLAALGAFLAVSAKLSVLPLALACLGATGFSRPRAWLVPLAGVALALAGHAAYDFARFHDVLETGYGAQASASAFTTPLFVGVYGLLVSSGKGVLWFAPAIALAPWGLGEMLRSRAHRDAPRHGEDVRRAAWAIGAAWAIALFQYGRFQHWAGDGSWGPRYLVPVLPLAFLAVGFALEHAGRVRRRVAAVLGIAGVLVSMGGEAIHFGAQMREAGDYPYTLALEDPHFMEASHFNPRYTPIVAHWRMFLRNAGEHLTGHAPKLGASGPVDPRLGITPAEQAALLHAIDWWWLYASYAGYPFALLFAAALVLKGALLAAAAWTWRAVRREPA